LFITHTPLFKAGLILVVFSSFCLAYNCTRSGDNQTESATSDETPQTFDHRFVGDRTCQSCHQEQWDEWKGSHHHYAMALPDTESVRGDFSDVEFTEGSDRYRFYRQGEDFMVEAPGQDGQSQAYRVEYTFGWEPLQQYLVDIGKGKFQALHAAWDSEKQEWFSLYPDEKFEPGDWLHWTGGAMNWNTMCADCHSTGVSQNYIAEADSFHTSYFGITVGCESCHGPGREHTELMDSEEGSRASAERIRKDLALAGNPSQSIEISTCAPCHSLRQKLTNNFPHTGDYLDHYDPSLPHPETYFPDGQIREEVYVYGSFLQSRMHAEGVQCSDCHDPHSLQLKTNIDDNSLCMQCHEPQYNSPEHHFHEPNTESSQCISCHMTGRYYMQVDFRRDHSFRVPRPDLSRTYDTPNACNGCHENRSPEWAAQAIEEWYGPERPDHFSAVLSRASAEGPEASEALTSLIADTAQPEIIRATAIWYLGQFSPQQHADLFRRELESESPLIRKSAAKALGNLPSEVRRTSLPAALDDSTRAVRLAAVSGLTEFEEASFGPALRQAFAQALDEYRQQLEVSAYFPQGQMNRGRFYEQRGETGKAIRAYRRAIEIDPHFNPARVNLAMLYNTQGRNDEAEKLLRTVTEQEPGFGRGWYSLALLLAEEGRLDESIPYFDKASQLISGDSRVHYNRAIALQTLGRPQQAKQAYRQALELEPDNPDYLYGIVTLYSQQERYSDALAYAEKLKRLFPGNRQIEKLIEEIKKKNIE